MTSSRRNCLIFILLFAVCEEYLTSGTPVSLPEGEVVQNASQVISVNPTPANSEVSDGGNYFIPGGIRGSAKVDDLPVGGVSNGDNYFIPGGIRYSAQVDEVPAGGIRGNVQENVVASDSVAPSLNSGNKLEANLGRDEEWNYEHHINFGSGQGQESTALPPNGDNYFIPGGIRGSAKVEDLPAGGAPNGDKYFIPGGIRGSAKVEDLPAGGVPNGEKYFIPGGIRYSAQVDEVPAGGIRGNVQENVEASDSVAPSLNSGNRLEANPGRDEEWNYEHHINFGSGQGQESTALPPNGDNYFIPGGIRGSAKVEDLPAGGAPNGDKYFIPGGIRYSAQVDEVPAGGIRGNVQENVSASDSVAPSLNSGNKLEANLGRDEEWNYEHHINFGSGQGQESTALPPNGDNYFIPGGIRGSAKVEDLPAGGVPNGDKYFIPGGIRGPAKVEDLPAEGVPNGDKYFIPGGIRGSAKVEDLPAGGVPNGENYFIPGGIRGSAKVEELPAGGVPNGENYFIPGGIRGSAKVEDLPSGGVPNGDKYFIPGGIRGSAKVEDLPAGGVPNGGNYFIPGGIRGSAKVEHLPAGGVPNGENYFIPGGIRGSAKVEDLPAGGVPNGENYFIPGGIRGSAKVEDLPAGGVPNGENYFIPGGIRGSAKVEDLPAGAVPNGDKYFIPGGIRYSAQVDGVPAGGIRGTAPENLTVSAGGAPALNSGNKLGTNISDEEYDEDKIPDRNGGSGFDVAPFPMLTLQSAAPAGGIRDSELELEIKVKKPAGGIRNVGEEVPMGAPAGGIRSYNLEVPAGGIRASLGSNFDEKGDEYDVSSQNEFIVTPYPENLELSAVPAGGIRGSGALESKLNAPAGGIRDSNDESLVAPTGGIRDSAEEVVTSGGIRGTADENIQIPAVGIRDSPQVNLNASAGGITNTSESSLFAPAGGIRDSIAKNFRKLVEFITPGGGNKDSVDNVEATGRGMKDSADNIEVPAGGISDSAGKPKKPMKRPMENLEAPAGGIPVGGIKSVKAPLGSMDYMEEVLEIITSTESNYFLEGGIRGSADNLEVPAGGIRGSAGNPKKPMKRPMENLEAPAGGIRGSADNLDVPAGGIRGSAGKPKKPMKRPMENLEAPAGGIPVGGIKSIKAPLGSMDYMEEVLEIITSTESNYFLEGGIRGSADNLEVPAGGIRGSAGNPKKPMKRPMESLEAPAGGIRDAAQESPQAPAAALRWFSRDPPVGGIKSNKAPLGGIKGSLNAGLDYVEEVLEVITSTESSYFLEGGIRGSAQEAPAAALRGDNNQQESFILPTSEVSGSIQVPTGGIRGPQDELVAPAGGIRDTPQAELEAPAGGIRAPVNAEFDPVTKSPLAGGLQMPVPYFAVLSSQFESCTEPGNFSIPGSCRQYTTCSPTTYHLMTFECPENSAFSPILRRCTRDVSPCTDLGPECVTEGSIADPVDQKFYFWCVQSQLGGFHKYHVKCEMHEQFIPLNGRCVPMAHGVAVFETDRDIAKHEWKQLKKELKLRAKQQKKQLKLEAKAKFHSEKHVVKDDEEEDD